MSDEDPWHGLRTELVNLEIFTLERLKEFDLFILLDNHLSNLKL